MMLLDSTDGGGSDNFGRWCRRLATQSRGKTGLFFAVIVGLQNGFYRKQRSPVDGCFSERWPSEPSPEVCNILYPTLRHRHHRGKSDVFPFENYIINSHASWPTSFSLQKSMRFGRVAIGSSTNDNLLFIVHTQWSRNFHAELRLNIFREFPKAK